MFGSKMRAVARDDRRSSNNAPGSVCCERESRCGPTKGSVFLWYDRRRDLVLGSFPLFLPVSEGYPEQTYQAEDRLDVGLIHIH